MKIKNWFIACAFVSAPAIAEECKVNADLIGAKYEITRNSKDGKKTSTTHFNLWRNSYQVAQENEASEMTEVWEKTRNGKVKLIRYFDHHKRGIEYQPEDIKNESVERVWASKYQLFDETQLSSFKKVSSTGKGCDKVDNYESGSVNISWNPVLKLAKKYEEKDQHGSVQWKLESVVTDKNTVMAEYKARDEYQVTDYIDIGDNESDPFLRQMINLGFVEHGASGFYDSEGHVLESRDNHHGHNH